MATVNITADMNEAETVTIADAAAAAGSHLFQFFTDGKNVFNIATQDLSGDAVDAVTVNDDTSYEFDISAAQAQLLDGVASTYKHYLLDGEGGKTLMNEGSVTVTPLTGGALTTLVPFINGDNVKTIGGTEATLLESDDIVYLNPTVGTTLVVTLPDATTMPTKKYELYLIGAGDASVIVPEGLLELIALETAGDACFIRAKGDDDADDWKVFFRYIQP